MTFPTFFRTHWERQREVRETVEGRARERVGVSKWEQSLYCFILQRKEEK